MRRATPKANILIPNRRNSIPDVFHEFYKNFKTKKNLSDPVLSDDE